MNSTIQDDTPLGRLMHDFHCTNPDTMYYPDLAARARYFIQNDEGPRVFQYLRKFHNFDTL